jgi:hypothetical protein
MSSSRRRLMYVALAVGTIGVGLLVHRRGDALPPALRDILGDALWAMMMTWWIGALLPSVRLPVRAAVASAVCFAVEFSQLYQSPQINALRATTLGHLLLGSDFDERDLVAYTSGVLVAALIEYAVTRRKNRLDRATVR